MRLRTTLAALLLATGAAVDLAAQQPSAATSLTPSEELRREIEGLGGEAPLPPRKSRVLN